MQQTSSDISPTGLSDTLSSALIRNRLRGDISANFHTLVERLHLTALVAAHNKYLLYDQGSPENASHEYLLFTERGQGRNAISIGDEIDRYSAGIFSRDCNAKCVWLLSV